MVTLDRVAEYRRVIRSVADWAARQEDIAGVAVVGSWARNHEHMGSDVDLVILTDGKERYRSDSSWVEAAVGGPAEILRTQDWGPLTERRVALPSGLEIESGFASRAWALTDPVEAGTARVVGDGCSPLVDPEGAFARLIAAVDPGTEARRHRARSGMIPMNLRREEDDMAEPSETARRHDEAFNAQDAEGRRAIEAPDIEAVLPGGLVLHGPDQTLGIVRAFWEALPDARIVLDNQIVSDETVVAEGTLTGTHTGMFRAPQGEVPASGNPVRLRYASVKQIRDGKVAREHLYFDQLEFLQQIGALPPPGQ